MIQLLILSVTAIVVVLGLIVLITGLLLAGALIASMWVSSKAQDVWQSRVEQNTGYRSGLGRRWNPASDFRVA